MSILVHPDKNRDDTDRAKKAFDAVNKAYKTLENEEGFKRCQEIVEEAKMKTEEMVSYSSGGRIAERCTLRVYRCFIPLPACGIVDYYARWKITLILITRTCGQAKNFFSIRAPSISKMCQNYADSSGFVPDYFWKLLDCPSFA